MSCLCRFRRIVACSRCSLPHRPSANAGSPRGAPRVRVARGLLACTTKVVVGSHSAVSGRLTSLSPPLGLSQHVSMLLLGPPGDAACVFRIGIWHGVRRRSGLQPTDGTSAARTATFARRPANIVDPARDRVLEVGACMGEGTEAGGFGIEEAGNIRGTDSYRHGVSPPPFFPGREERQQNAFRFSSTRDKRTLRQGCTIRPFFAPRSWIKALFFWRTD